MIKVFAFVRVRTLAVVSVIVVSTIAGLPTLSQEAEGEGQPSPTLSEEAAQPEATASEATKEGNENVALATSDPQIPSDRLEVLVKPLTQEQLQIVVDRWFVLLQEKAREISDLEYSIKLQEESIGGAVDTAAEEQVVESTRLQSEQTSLISRFNVVLDAFEAKGGETETYRQYVGAISGVDLTNTTGLGLRFTTWLKSEEGGILLGINILKFSGILIVAAIAAPRVGKIVDSLLGRTDAISSLFRDFIVVVTKRATLFVGALIGLASLGVSLGPLAALVGGLSFIAAFALQSNLGNFASGLMLLIYKPFDMGNIVRMPDGTQGRVISITLANISLRNYQGKIFVFPNSMVWGSKITNVVPGDERMIEFALPVGFSVDCQKIGEIWQRIAKEHPEVVHEKGIDSYPWFNLGSKHLEYQLTAWANVKRYWSVYSDLWITLHAELRKADIKFAVEQMERYIAIAKNGEEQPQLPAQLRGETEHVSENTLDR